MTRRRSSALEAWGEGVHRPWFVGVGAAFLLQSAALGCSSGGGSGAGVVVRDSAGVQIVESMAPQWKEGDAWVVEPEPSLEIGADPNHPAAQLYGVGDVVVLESGRVVVVNEGLVSVLLFDSAGDLLAPVGRQGEGPGEYRRVDAAYRCPGDTVVVNAFSQVSFFDSHAQFLRSVRLNPTAGDGSSLRAQGVASDCSRFLLRGGYSVPELGEVGRVSYTLFWGTLDNLSRDSLQARPGWEAEVQLIDDWPQPLPLPWGARAAWAVSKAGGEDRVYLTMADRPDVRVFDGGGHLVRILRWPVAAAPVTASDRTLYAEKRGRWLERYPRVEEAVPDLGAYAYVPSEKPILLGLLADDEGNLWARAYPGDVAGRPDLFDYTDPDAPFRENPPPDAPPAQWYVFDPNGRLLGTVGVPADLAVRAVHRDMVVGVWRDSLDVESVRFHRLRKQGSR